MAVVAFTGWHAVNFKDIGIRIVHCQRKQVNDIYLSEGKPTSFQIKKKVTPKGVIRLKGVTKTRV